MVRWVKCIVQLIKIIHSKLEYTCNTLITNKRTRLSQLAYQQYFSIFHLFPTICSPLSTPTIKPPSRESSAHSFDWRSLKSGKHHKTAHFIACLLLYGALFTVFRVIRWKVLGFLSICLLAGERKGFHSRKWPQIVTSRFQFGPSVRCSRFVWRRKS